ncbi:hypothetical protein NDU88_005454 [Pleurodeles waltl]|uniref:Uncharacterized protein n=1 Tax=Pleurodeles waltl TaxID=8319 RepID=A0AAV7WUR9_PLEWA|nr:hypothetical protein NDU88_005454 [Pleurodeles waltl]
MFKTEKPTLKLHGGWFSKPCHEARKSLKKALKAQPSDKVYVRSTRAQNKAVLHERKRQLKKQAWEDLEGLIHVLEDRK